MKFQELYDTDREKSRTVMFGPEPTFSRLEETFKTMRKLGSVHNASDVARRIYDALPGIFEPSEHEIDEVMEAVSDAGGEGTEKDFRRAARDLKILRVALSLQSIFDYEVEFTDEDSQEWVAECFKRFALA